jgi:16S rRNA (guanine527-N7)-methyltransferase
MAKTLNEFQQALQKYDVNADELASEDVSERVQQYCVLLWHKNQQINLTRHTDWDKFVSRDLVDTLELSKLIGEGQEVLDVGSGGGVPGLLLAILRPDLEVSLAESVGKKALVLAEFAEALGVHVQVFNERAEKILTDFRYDVTTARAVGSISKMCTWFEDRWPYIGRLLATKGPGWVTERDEANEKGLLEGIQIEIAAQYPTPGMEWESYILDIKKVA